MGCVGSVTQEPDGDGEACLNWLPSAHVRAIANKDPVDSLQISRRMWINQEAIFSILSGQSGSDVPYLPFPPGEERRSKAEDQDIHLLRIQYRTWFNQEAIFKLLLGEPVSNLPFIPSNCVRVVDEGQWGMVAMVRRIWINQEAIFNAILGHSVSTFPYPPSERIRKAATSAVVDQLQITRRMLLNEESIFNKAHMKASPHEERCGVLETMPAGPINNLKIDC